MSKSTHQIAIKGVDQTAGAFASIRGRAAATGASIRSMMGGAIAAAGAYLSLRAISGTINDLGHLSDIAMNAGTSVEFLQKTSTAFQISGLNIGIDRFAKIFQYLERATGKTGEGPFWEAVKAVSAIEDPLKRGAELTRVFGKGGVELQPLINGGAEVVEKFQKLASIMPSVSTAAAEAGDAVADSQTILGRGVSTMWSNAIGYLCQLWGDEFPGGVRAGALNAVNYLEYALKKMWTQVTKWGTKIAAAGQAMWNWAANGYSWEQAWSEFGEVNAIIDNDMNSKLAAIDKARADYKANLAGLNVDDLAGAFGPRRLGQEIGDAAAAKIKKVTNTLIMGESNAAKKLALFGPEYQNEAKKQTKLLEQIAENTAESPSDSIDIASANLNGN